MPPMQQQEGPPDHQRFATDSGFMVADPDTGALEPEVDDVVEAAPLSAEESAAIDAEVEKRLADLP